MNKLTWILGGTRVEKEEEKVTAVDKPVRKHETEAEPGPGEDDSLKKRTQSALQGSEISDRSLADNRKRADTMRADNIEVKAEMDDIIVAAIEKQVADACVDIDECDGAADVVIEQVV